MNPSTPSAAEHKILSNTMARLILLCVVVGLIAGLGAIAFYWMLDVTRHFTLDALAGYRPGKPGGEFELLEPTATPLRKWVLFILPAVGGLISGALVYWFAPEAAGHGTDAAIESYHFRQGAVRARVPLIKAITSAVTIGTGGSGGREGPIAQIGAGFGSILAERLRLTADERRTLMAAGMAAGIGAIFNAPLAGALFAAEVLYKDMDLEHEVLVPAFISSIVAYSVFALRFGWSPVFLTPDFVFQNPMQLIPYLGLAVVLALCARLFIKIFYFTHNTFQRWRIPNHFKPAIGGLMVGFMGLFVRDAMGTGYHVIQQALTDPHTLGIGLLLAVAFGKMLTTSFSIGSGGSGGVFGPSIVIGGALGGAFGLIVLPLFPDIEIGAFVLVGMAGFFAAAANCPISTIIMVSELTGNYHLLVPSMLVCVVSYLLCRGSSLYDKQLQSRLEAPSKMGNMLSAVLRKISIRQALAERPEGDGGYPLVTITESMRLGSIVEKFSESEQTCFPIVNEQGKMTGMVDGRDIRNTLGEQAVADLVVALDLAKPPITLSLDETLLAAVHKMNATNIDELIVVDPDDEDIPLTTLSHYRVVQVYDQSLYSAQS